MKLRNLSVVTWALILSACSNTAPFDNANGTAKVVTKANVDWQHLNPARGDKAPQAATLWGDRGVDRATGFLLKPKDGFQSPPHIHNVSYRGIVIRGLIHNDDPSAAKMWMPAGSYWTQPKGESHITAAKGDDTLAYIEIEQGPYLVKPKKQAFDSGERPVNVDANNLVWLGAEQITWLEEEQKGVEVSYLWGGMDSNELNGRLLKLPSGFKGRLSSANAKLQLVVISGILDLQIDGKETVLEPGSYFESKQGQSQKLVNYDAADVVLYVRTKGDSLVLKK